MSKIVSLQAHKKLLFYILIFLNLFVVCLHLFKSCREWCILCNIYLHTPLYLAPANTIWTLCAGKIYIDYLNIFTDIGRYPKLITVSMHMFKDVGQCHKNTTNTMHIFKDIYRTVSKCGKKLCNNYLHSLSRSKQEKHLSFYFLILYDLVPKGVHARGYALQLKIKHCWKRFLFEMLCCVLAWMNVVQIISATRLWLISKYSHHTLKKHRKMTAKNRHPCTKWFSSLCLQTNCKQMEKQSLICTRKTSFYTDNITSTLMIVVFSINWSQMFAL